MSGLNHFLRSARKRANKTLSRVALESGLDYWAYVRLERPKGRKTFPPPETVERIAASLGVSEAELMEAAGYRCRRGAHAAE